MQRTTLGPVLALFVCLCVLAGLLLFLSVDNTPSRNEAPGGARPRPDAASDHIQGAAAPAVAETERPDDQQDRPPHPAPGGPDALDVVSEILGNAGPSHSLKGRVLTPEGLPAAGAEMNITCNGKNAIQSAVSDASGRFIADVRPGSYEVFARAPAGWARLVTDVPGNELIIELSPYLVVSGVAVDEQGIEVPGARVSLRPLTPGQSAERQHWLNPETGNLETDRLGRFKLQIGEAGPYRAGAVTEDGFCGYSEPFTVEISGVLPYVRIVLKNGVSVGGRILDADRNAIVGAEVLIRAAEDESPNTEFSPMAQQETVSDANGAYLFEHVPPNIYRVKARADGFAPLEREDIAVDGDSDVEDLDLVLTAGGTLRGTIRGCANPERSGVHLSNGPVNASPEVDSSGRFVSENLPAGTYFVIVTAPSGGANGADAPLMQTARVTDGEVTDVVFDLGAAPAITGGVRFLSERRYSEIFVRLAPPGTTAAFPKGDERDPRIQQFLQESVAFTIMGEEPEFSLSGVAPGEYELFFYDMGGDTSDNSGSAADELVQPIHMQRVRILSGSNRVDVDLP